MEIRLPASGVGALGIRIAYFRMSRECVTAFLARGPMSRIYRARGIRSEAVQCSHRTDGRLASATRISRRIAGEIGRRLA